MRDQLLQLLAQVRGAWRFRWTALLVAWVVAIFGWVAVALLPNQYEARAKVFVDAESVLKPLLQGLAVNTDVMNQVNMMSRVLMSRPNLEKVAQETDLYLRAPTPEAFQRMIEGLPQRIGLIGSGNVYSVSFRDHDPQMAYRVVKTLVDAFVESAIGGKRDDASVAERFLEQEKARLDAQLREAEDRLAQFKKDNVGLMPGEAGDYYTRRQAAADELAKLHSQYAIAEQKRDELRRQLLGEEPTFGLFSSDGTTKGTGRSAAVDAKLAEYQRQLDQLLLEYTENHPRVKALRETMTQLRERKDAASERASLVEQPDPMRLAARELDVNRVYQSIKINLGGAELELVELSKKIALQQAIVADLQAKVNIAPEVEARLKQLDRDYTGNRERYDEVVRSLATAGLSKRADDSREQLKFRIVEPPAVPLVPLSPNRPLLATAVFVFALGAGIVMAVLRNLIKPVFSDRNSLAAVAQIPVLGVVTLARGMSAAMGGRSLQWAGGVIGLLVIYGVAVIAAARLAALFGSAPG